MPHDWFPKITIPISNRMVLITKWVRFANNSHKSGAILVEPCVHGFIEAIQLGRKVIVHHMPIKTINQLTNIVELVLEFRIWLVSVVDGTINGLEVGQRHVDV